MGQTPAKECVLKSAPMNEPVQHLGGGEPETYVTTLGDIYVSPHWVSTPSGQFPLRGTTWTMSEMTHRQESMSPVGVVLCILFIWVCLLGLFFLLMKKRTISGFIQVTVHGNGMQHSALIPVTSHQTVGRVYQAVNHVRSLAAAA